jgi:hypothetical protein
MSSISGGIGTPLEPARKIDRASLLDFEASHVPSQVDENALSKISGESILAILRSEMDRPMQLGRRCVRPSNFRREQRL